MIPRWKADRTSPVAAAAILKYGMKDIVNLFNGFGRGGKEEKSLPILWDKKKSYKVDERDEIAVLVVLIVSPSSL